MPLKSIAVVFSQLELDDPRLLAARLHEIDRPAEADSHHPLAVISRVVLNRHIRDIIRHRHPEASGLWHVMQKVGNDPLSIQDSRSLVYLHIRPEHRARLLRHITRVRERVIPVRAALGAPYVHSSLLNRYINTAMVGRRFTSPSRLRIVLKFVSRVKLLSVLPEPSLAFDGYHPARL
jgi:hypothetical protein